MNKNVDSKRRRALVRKLARALGTGEIADPDRELARDVMALTLLLELPAGKIADLERAKALEAERKATRLLAHHRFLKKHDAPQKCTYSCSSLWARSWTP
jgi:hypothetical protein